MARPGATNFVINLQVDLAIKQKPDLIVIGGTSSDRIQIVTEPDNWRAPLELKHIVYKGYKCSSETELMSNEEFIVADTLANVVEAPYVSVPQNTKDAVRNYIAELHDTGLQYHIDGCILRDSLRKLIDSGLNFIFIPEFGIIGAAYTTIIAYAVMVTILYYISRYIYLVNYEFKRLGAVFLFTVVPIGLSYFYLPDGVIARFFFKCALCIIPLIMYYFSKFLKNEEKNYILQMIKKDSSD